MYVYMCIYIYVYKYMSVYVKIYTCVYQSVTSMEPSFPAGRGPLRAVRGRGLWLADDQRGPVDGGERGPRHLSHMSHCQNSLQRGYIEIM